MEYYGTAECGWRCSPDLGAGSHVFAQIDLFLYLSMDIVKRKIRYNFRRLNSVSTEKVFIDTQRFVIKVSTSGRHGLPLMEILKPQNYLSMSNG